MMTEEELALYDDAMKKGHYLEGASIVLGAAWREEERERLERQRESAEFWAAWKKQRDEAGEP